MAASAVPKQAVTETAVTESLLFHPKSTLAIGAVVAHCSVEKRKDSCDKSIGGNQLRKLLYYCLNGNRWGSI